MELQVLFKLLISHKLLKRFVAYALECCVRRTNDIARSEYEIVGDYTFEFRFLEGGGGE